MFAGLTRNKVFVYTFWSAEPESQPALISRMANRIEAAASLSLDEAKGRQKVLRRQITGGCKQIENLVGSAGSRREVRRLLEVLRNQLAEADAINDRLVELLEDPEATAQHEAHLTYEASVDAAKGRVEEYLASREGDEASVVDAEAQQRQQALLATAQRVQDMRKELLEAEAALRNLGGEPENPEDPPEAPEAPDTPPDEEVHPEDSISAVGNQPDPAPIQTTAAYRDALRRLKEACGNRAVMRAAHLQILDRIESPRGDPASFKRFAERVHTHLFNLTCIGETSHADLIERLAQRLPVAERLAWNDGRGVGLERRTIIKFGEWMCIRAAAYQNAYAIASEQLNRAANGTGGRGEQRATSQQNGRQPSRNARAHYGAAGSDGRSDRVRPAPGPPYCFKCEGEHSLADCSIFKEMTVQDRIGFCIRRGMCFGCFGVRHVTRECRSRRSCGINGCKLSHHRLLHSDASPNQPAPARSTPAAPETVLARPHSAVALSATRTVAFGVVQLDALSSDGSKVPVNVMLDGGSDSTIFRDGFIRRLGLQGRRQLLRIAEVADASTNYPSSEHLTLQIEAAFGETVFVNGSTVRSITQAVPVIEWELLRDRLAHFHDLPPLRSSGGQVDVLLGLDYATLMAPSDSRCGQENEPIAVRTRVGWVLQGVVDDGRVNRSIRIHRALVTTNLSDQLMAQLRRFCITDQFGSETATPAMSEEHRRAADMLEKGIEKLDIGYRAPVLWKSGTSPVLPDNKVIAEQRLRSLVHKFRRSSVNMKITTERRWRRISKRGMHVA